MALHLCSQMMPCDIGLQFRSSDSGVFPTTPPIRHCCFCKRISVRRQKRKHERYNQYLSKPKLSFPESSPTPLLPEQNNFPQTKVEALEAILSNLEKAANNGVEIQDPSIFASLLETCYQLKAIDHGIRVHRVIPPKLLRKNVGVSSKLLRLYAAYGLIEEAHQVFDEMPERESSAFPWNSLISGYAERGLYEDALALYFQMVEEGVEPDRYTFPRVLKACGGLGLIQVGEEVHRHIIRFGFGNNQFVLNGLIDMYAKCGDIRRARKVFDISLDKDLVSWNSMLLGFLKHDLTPEAVRTFRRMLQDGHQPDSVTISAILSSMPPFEIGKQVHGWVLRQGMEWNLSIANSLITMYSNEKKLEQVRWMFDQMPVKDLVSWNAIISAHSKDSKSLEYFENMVNSGTSPDRVTFVSLLSACACLEMVEDGKRLFSMMLEQYDIHPGMEHYACMVNIYGKAGFINDAYNVIVGIMEFEAGPTVWGALLYACYLHGNVNIGEIAANRLFELEPENEHNFELLIKIYKKAGQLADAERVQAMMTERGL